MQKRFENQFHASIRTGRKLRGSPICLGGNKFPKSIVNVALSIMRPDFLPRKTNSVREIHRNVARDKFGRKERILEMLFVPK